MDDYKELVVWQKSMRLVKEVYNLIKLLPDNEKFALCDQMRRSAVSIPSNISEGYGRGTTTDYLRFLTIARGSKYEIETQIHICIMLDYFDEITAKTAFDLCEEINKMLNSMIKKLT